MADEYEKDEVIKELLKKLDESDSKVNQLNTAISSGGVAGPEGNLIQYQLDSAEILDKLEHFYKGDHEGYDEGGNLVWKEQTNEDLIPLNKFGVNSMMEIVTKYIDKNTSLSYYSEERIYEIIADLGDEMALYLFCNYEKMGLDTYFKKTKFRILIVTTLHLIESTYRRAIKGTTSRDINQSRIITQTDQMGNRFLQPQPQNKRTGILQRFGF